MKLIIENVFRISLKNTEEQSIALINSFVQDAVYERIWNTYKHTDKELKQKDASKTGGNHVRHVVKPVEDRLIRVEIELRTMKANQESGKDRKTAFETSGKVKENINKLYLI